MEETTVIIMKTKTEKEMFTLIMDYANSDPKIRAVLLNGSRANPNSKKDIFQDYDVACYVTNVEPFKNENDVVSYFGEMMIVEQPNIGPWPPHDADGSYHNYNMQLLDGNRIDLSFFHIDTLKNRTKDSLTLVLLDKDNLCGHLPPPDEKSYFISPPTKDLYTGCCTAFYFALGSHIPKTIWRKSLPLLKFYIEGWLREPVLMMLSWEIGIKTGFDKSIGSKGKFIQQFLEPEKWEEYLKTYAGSDYDDLWDSLFVFHEFFKQSAEFVAFEYNFDFPVETSLKVCSFLNHVRNLSENAKRIY